jgi:ATP-dependent Clp protease ATP-binding subunit ClpA
MDAGQRLAELAAEAADAPTPRAALRQLAGLRRELDAFERRQVARALADGASFAAIARDLGISRQAVHRRFRALAARAQPLVTAPEVRRVLHYAREEAASVGAELGSQHVLLAVLRAGDLAAADLLRAEGVSLGRASTHVEGAATGAELFRRTAAVHDLRALLEAPARAARARRSRSIEVEDLLVGALEDSAGGAARTLRAQGVEPDAIRERLRRQLPRAPRTPPLPPAASRSPDGR